MISYCLQEFHRLPPTTTVPTPIKGSGAEQGTPIVFEAWLSFGETSSKQDTACQPGAGMKVAWKAWLSLWKVK